MSLAWHSVFDYLRPHKTNDMDINEKYMRRAIQLAECATGLTYPNPMVGAVIVHNDRIIGEGYHRKAGTGHAEVNAVNSVKDKTLLADSTIYVSLEPCAHFGRTPPCAKLIIDNKIPRVVVGCIDTFSEVSGKGIEMLREAGVEVITGVLEKECRELNRRFFTFHEKHRPYIILKWAQSADGYIDILRDASQQATWLTNDQCRRIVHKQRTQEQSIMIGAKTAIMDNPSLTVRNWTGNQPTRIILSPNNSLSATLKVLTDGNETIVLNKMIDNGGTNITYKTLEKSDPNTIASTLYGMGIMSVIIEGGRQTLQTFLDEGIWDEAFVYRSAKVLGNGIEAPTFRTGDHTIATTDIINGVQLQQISRNR